MDLLHTAAQLSTGGAGEFLSWFDILPGSLDLLVLVEESERVSAGGSGGQV